MTGGAGHILDSINRLRQNRSNRTSQKKKFGANKKDPIYSKGNTNNRPLFKVSDEKLKKIKERIRTTAKREKWRIFVISISIMIALLLAMLYVIL